ncbi:endonuclease/exonuclease/phosphatase family protein [Nocardiopsis sp. NPDC006139]|uniref:endonuclease/exonuclease/phosphatase family protein n=1 Tax=Nocardiopsis sp. NPDC006139 TaxID=3154578 RepID=UPI0033B46214
MTSSTTVTVVAQNMSHSGLYTPNGDPDPDRWNGLMAAITEHRPDILLLQEIGKWHDYNRQPLFHAERDLGLRMAGHIITPAGGGTGVMINPDTIHIQQFEDRYQHMVHHGLGVAVLELPGLDTPLAAISAHLTPYSATAAATEAQVMVARAYRYGGLGLVGGDVNHFSHRDDPAAVPDPATIPPYNRSSRWLVDADGSLVPNRIVGRTLQLGGLTDVALHMADRTGDTSLLAPTGRGRCRVDQFWVTPPLVPAITSYVHHQHEFSDHSLILMRLDTSLVDINAALPEWI